MIRYVVDACAAVEYLLGKGLSLQIAAARLADAPLLTADGPLSRAPLPGIIVQNVRVG